MSVPPSMTAGSVHPNGTLAPPLWARQLVENGSSTSLPVPLESLEAEMSASDGYTMTSVRLRGVDAMNILTFQASVADAYRVILEQIRGDHPLRFWAFLPRIHTDYGNGLDRYMIFNVGRFAAFSAWMGGPGAFAEAMPAGSAVGTWGRELVLYGLASRWPGKPVENPRQIPSYRYSKRFGPLPPCFARATVVRRRPLEPDVLLVGGTASIVGEDSQHPEDVLAQTDETFRNLASVVRSACLPKAAAGVEGAKSLREWLGLFRDLRVYYREAQDRAAILARIEASFARVRRVEALPAELCRPELLVEIEGVAELPPEE